MGPDPNEEERKPEPPDPRDNPDEGDSSLNDFAEGESDDETPTPQTDTDGSVADLSPDSPPERQSDAWVLEHLRENGGEVFANNHSVAHYVGAVSTEATVDTADTDGTVLDPDHELWGCSQFVDDRVITVEDARKELQESFDRLRHNDWVELDDSSAPPAMTQLVVANE